METSELINRVTDRMTEFLEAYEGTFGMGGAKSSVAIFRTELRRILCDEFKDRRIVSIPDLKNKLTIEKGYNPVVGAYVFKTGLTAKSFVSREDYDRCASAVESGFLETLEDSLKESFIRSLDNGGR